MFERFTENARRTIVFARWEAIQRASSNIESEHIALALLRDSWLADGLLNAMAVAEIRRDFPAIDIEKEVHTSPDVPLSNESKRVIQFSAEEADALLDQHIGTEHLLLGLLREKRSRAAGMLGRGGLELENLRREIRGIPRETRKAKGGEQAARWGAAGIPDGYTQPRLFYNPCSETAVVEFQRPGDGVHWLRRLFMRHKNAETYEPIGDPEEDVSYESVVTCETRPVIAFNAMRFTKRGSGEWAGAYLFDLVKREQSPCVTRDSFVAPAPYSGGWIADILNLSDDGRHAFVRAGLEMRHENGADMHYFVARVDLDSRQLELISRLKNVFF